MSQTQEIINQGKAAIANTYGRYDLVFQSGKGMWLQDIEGQKYLDFVAGIAVDALGHGDEGYANMLKEQAQDLVHVSNLYWNAPNVEVAEILKKWSGQDKVFFCNSGAEANEAALKFARIYGEDARYEIITMTNSFHGRTMGSLAMTGQTKYQKHFNPLTPGVSYVPFNDYEALEAAITPKTVAVLIEIIQGEGGIIMAEADYLQKVTALLDQKDILLMVDEVQTGIGRTGKAFAYQLFDLKPDIVSVAKGVAGGFPMGASLISKRVADKLYPSCHATTFGGTALASAASKYVLTTIEEQGLIENADKVGTYLKGALEGLCDKYACVEGTRGIGLIQGIKIADDTPVSGIINAAIGTGLLLVGAGHQVIRFVPPLICSQTDVDVMIEKLESVLKAL